MNIKQLAKKILSDSEYKELLNAIKLMENQEIEYLYNQYEGMIGRTIFIHSYEDFKDFIRENNTIEQNIFILGFFAEKAQCIEIGGYEENLEIKINQFIVGFSKNIELHTCIAQLSDKVYTDYDDEDNLHEYIIKLNNLLTHYNLKLVLFFNDVYCGCAYHLFLLNNSMANIILHEWRDDDIQIVS